MEAFIYDSVRTPRARGKASGSLHTLSPLELASTVLRALPARSSFDTAVVDEVILGCVEAVCDQGAKLLHSA